jgi:prepilin-type N-terminal cleavage/methylation domain-containing protein
MRQRGLALDQRGFTLTELLVAMAMMAFVLSAGLLALQAGTQASEVATGRAEAQSNVRFALGQIIADMRGAGYDPTGNGFDPVDGGTLALASVQIVSDLNANGAIDVPGNPCDASGPAERVRYRQVGTDLMRAVMTTNTVAACEAVLIGGVQSLTFTYMDANGTALPAAAASAPNVRAIDISLTLKPESITGSRQGAGTATMRDRARLRNR